MSNLVGGDSSRRHNLDSRQIGELTTFNNTITIPGEDLEAGKTYRVRVRMQDNNGRWSHWSDAVQFVAGDSTDLVRDVLRITTALFVSALQSLLGK